MYSALVSFALAPQDFDLTFAQYFGTMSGARGFSNPNVQANPSTGYNTFQ
jgi:hypothetical protein